MANSALIDDLRKQFAENPRRVFARLANEYRKRGELDSAIEICRSHVPLQPGYISGHIVLGQALYDSGSLGEARASFETALTLDPENLIALRHMGDISSATGDLSSARSWYRQLLEIDPQNEEVATQLDSLSAAGSAPVERGGAEQNESVSWGEANPETIELAGEGAGAEPPAADREAEEALAEREPRADGAAEGSAASDVGEAIAVAEPSPVLAELAATEGHDLAVEGAPPVELLDLDSLALEASDLHESAFAATADAELVSRAVPPLYPPDPFGATAPDDYESPEEEAAPSAFATETMAELYLQQGFPDRALAIYRDLAARSPEDASLIERVAELEEASAVAPLPVAAARASRTTREFFGVLAYRRAPRGITSGEVAPALFAGPDASVSAADEVAATALAEAFGAPRSPDGVALSAIDLEGVSSADETPSMVDVFKTVEGVIEEEAPVWEAGESDAPVAATDAGDAPSGAVPGSAPAAGHAGRPGREASNALSLDDVFREAPLAGASRRESSVSFDEFFARRENGSAPESSNGTLPAEADEAGVDGHRTDDAPQDLELFHAWLDGLKG
jgi:tetratricopeptide (TPR) repeat protein